MTTITENISTLKSLMQVVEDNAQIGSEGNKAAAKKARVALNNMKKIITPMRIAINTLNKESRAKKKNT